MKLEVAFECPITGDEVKLRYEPNVDATYEDYKAADDAYREVGDSLIGNMGVLKALVVSVDGYERLERLPHHWVRPFASHCLLRQTLGANYGALLAAQLERALKRATQETSTASTPS